MKKLISFSIAIVLVCFGCEEKFSPNSNRGGTNISNNLILNKPNYIKPSGPIQSNVIILNYTYCFQVKYFHAIFGPSGQNLHKTLTIDPDYVIIGGGADIRPTTEGGTIPSAFLTESRPDFANNSWVASSKDHGTSSSHYLQVTAIGLKVTAGLYVTASALRSVMTVVETTGNVSAYPNATATLPAGYTLLGGGAWDNYGSGSGNLLVSSYPSSPTSWWAEGKQHKYSSPASITSYAIGIQSNLVKTTIMQAYQYVPYLWGNSPTIAPDPNAGVSGYPLLSCPGGKAGYFYTGRMLTNIVIPTNDQSQSVFVTSKDQFWNDPGYTYAYLIAFNDTGFCY